MFKCEQKAKDANKRFDDKIDKHDVLFSLKINVFKCFYCNDIITSHKQWQLDHFHPRANGGLNKRENLVACCKWCNTMKNALDGHSFINKCNQIIENNFFTLNNLSCVTSNKVKTESYRKVSKTLKKYNISQEDLIRIKELITNVNQLVNILPN
jgi:hypothetical protein